MADNEFEIEQVGEVYAQALVNLARQQGALDAITDDVRSIGELYRSNPGFAQLMGAATLSVEEHAAAVVKIFEGRVHPLTLETLKSMARRGRLMFLNGLVEGFEAILKRMSGRVDAEIVTAKELSPQALQRVTDAIGRATGGSPDVSVKVDSSLIGGVKVRVGDTLIDASVDTQLKQIRASLLSHGGSEMSKKANELVSA